MSNDAFRRPSKYANQVIDDSGVVAVPPAPAPISTPVPTPAMSNPEHKSAAHSQPKIRKRSATKTKISPKVIFPVLVTGVVLVAVWAGVSYLASHRTTKLPASFSATKSSFPAYYFARNQPPDSLKLKNDSASYTAGTLVFSLINSEGQTLGVTQQKLPADFTNSVLQGKESFDTAYGNATVSEVSGGRTTGSLITKDGTFVLINTSDPIDLNSVKDVLRSLAPVK